jgi:hypothetical protein
MEGSRQPDMAHRHESRVEVGVGSPLPDLGNVRTWPRKVGDVERHAGCGPSSNCPSAALSGVPLMK